MHKYIYIYIHLPCQGWLKGLTWSYNGHSYLPTNLSGLGPIRGFPAQSLPDISEEIAEVREDLRTLDQVGRGRMNMAKPREELREPPEFLLEPARAFWLSPSLRYETPRAK